MKKEEKELRSWHSIMEFVHLNKGGYFRDIRKFEKAVREDEKTQSIIRARRALRGTGGNYLAGRVAAAIRGKK